MRWRLPKTPSTTAWRDILEDIYRRKPDAIGFSCYIWNIGMVEKLMGELHKLVRLPVFLGGPEVTYDADKLLRKYPYLTGIFIGEGEATFAQVVKYYVKKNPESLEDIPGLMLRSGMTPERKPLNLRMCRFYTMIWRPLPTGLFTMKPSAAVRSVAATVCHPLIKPGVSGILRW